MKPELPPPAAVLFDLDGTLTVPVLDFELIRREAGLPAGAPILEELPKLSDEARAFALAVVDRHELAAAEASELNPGCRELLALLGERGVPTGVLTRNSRLVLDLTLARHKLAFPVRLSREDAPYKPDPHQVREACRVLGVRVERAWLVGDGENDVQSARAAGAVSVWLSHGKPRRFADEPTAACATLGDVRALLVPSPGTPGEG